jgi:mannose PTS system EIID component
MRPGRLFLRSFLIQGSWNPRDLLGTGVAWALGPWLRRADPGEEGAELARQGEPFNAHPFLAGLALGALVRMEEDGVPRDAQRRFREAVRGPLGALGDSLIWAGWLPSSLLLTGAALLLGLPPLLAVVLFLLLFNAVHLPLRVWAIRVGMRAGIGVGAVLQAARLGLWGERSRALGVFLSGLVGGLLVVRGWEELVLPAPAVLLWMGGGVGVFLLGWPGGGPSPRGSRVW